MKLTRVTLICPVCKKTARRSLKRGAGRRGVHQAESMVALCPRRHGAMVRK